MRDLVLRKPATGEDDDILLPDDHLRVRDITSFPMPRFSPSAPSRVRHHDLSPIVAPAASLTDAARLMAAEKINRLPVVDEGNLVAIVTRTDVLAGAGRVSASDD